MLPYNTVVASLAEMAERLVDESARDLFRRFCREIELFSDRVVIEITPFVVRFSGPVGFRIHVSPYRDLFRVSIDSSNPCEIRVSGEEGYIAALDLALKSFLDARARVALEAGTCIHAGENGLHVPPVHNHPEKA